MYKIATVFFAVLAFAALFLSPVAGLSMGKKHPKPGDGLSINPPTAKQAGAIIDAWKAEMWMQPMFQKWFYDTGRIFLATHHDDPGFADELIRWEGVDFKFILSDFKYGAEKYHRLRPAKCAKTGAWCLGKPEGWTGGDGRLTV